MQRFIGRSLDPKYANCGATIALAPDAAIPFNPSPIVRTEVGYDSPVIERTADLAPPAVNFAMSSITKVTQVAVYAEK